MSDTDATNIPPSVERVMAEVIVCAHNLSEDSILRFDLIASVISELERRLGRRYNDTERHIIYLILDDLETAKGWLAQFS